MLFYSQAVQNSQRAVPGLREMRKGVFLFIGYIKPECPKAVRRGVVSLRAMNNTRAFLFQALNIEG